ncbi:GMC oxidoreductase [Favolaschia claudopus]|uniref:GMC oxidoreductase n=1 Tax=Favolaschia claudopus TaxID=2862362 RepID=A0AAW0DN46_9AGAR
MSTPHTIQPSYDIVFAGGGTAGLIVATRLATAFPNLRIAVLESGPGTKGVFEHTTPGLYITHLAPTSKTTQFFFSKPSPGIGNRDLVFPSGMCVGGGSSINFMLYNRPSASDYDDWENKYGNKGWGSKHIIPLLQKAETYDIDPTKVNHGDSGPLHVTYGGDFFDIGKQYIEVGSKFEKDRPQSDEGSGFTADSINKFFQMPKWINKDGIRSDVAHHYYYNLGFKNLDVFDGVRVNRVIVTNGIATGVEYLFDKRVHAGASQDLKVVSASKLVIVSAGAMGSPLILERSGIGRKDILNKFKIPVLQELPGVGENYQDHPAIFSPYYADPDTKTMDGIFRGDVEFVAKVTPQYQKDRTGWLATNGVDAICKVRPHPDEVAQLGPEFKNYYDQVLKDYPDKPLFILMATGGSPGDAPAEPTKKFICHNTFLSYAASRGYLHISSSDLYANPDFDCGFFTDPADLATARWAYKKAREIFRRLPIYRGPRLVAHPQFAPGSPAAWDPEEKGPVALDAPVFTYTKEDDDAIDKFTRDVVITSWHSLGTCAMKPRDQNGVVDSSLNVYGIKNLKVADLSIPPSNVHSNTYATAIAVGEKAATIIAQELGGKL